MSNREEALLAWVAGAALGAIIAILQGRGIVSRTTGRLLLVVGSLAATALPVLLYGWETGWFLIGIVAVPGYLATFALANFPIERR